MLTFVYLAKKVRMRKLLTILFLGLIAILPSGAQTAADSARLSYAVRGRVVDSRRSRPMEAVHVSVPGRSYATVTNADGRFILKSNEAIRELEFSYVGYRTRRQAVAEDGRDIVVKLYREEAVLDEASIVSGDPRQIVEAAVEQIWNSYCTESRLLGCFYRETLQKRGRYTYVAEAVARLYKRKYDMSIYRDAAALEKSRVLISQRRRDTLSVKTQGGPAMALSLDVVKNPEILLNKDDMALYSYELLKPVYIGDRLQFVVAIHPDGEADYPLYHGKLYIDRELLSFTRVELSMDMKDKRKAAGVLLVRKPATLRFVPEEASYILNYSLKDGSSTLSYFRSTLRFSCDWRKRLFKTRYTAVNELVVTDVREPATPISRKEKFSVRDILEDKAAEFRDPDFWKDYNIIAPSESLEHAFDRLKKR